MKSITILLLLAATQLLAGNDNAGSCDIGVTPAATLLLPYFEVDTAAPLGAGANTIFTVTNTSHYPQIAHITLWTDWSYPVVTFNLFLTGYDVQSVSLWDVLVRGSIVPTGIDQPSLGNTSNPNFVTGGDRDALSTCQSLPGTIHTDLVLAILSALTKGKSLPPMGACTGPVGADHGTSARGYVTIDVTSYCSTQLPTDAAYYLGPTAPLLFDNVLIGDYQQIGPNFLPGYGGLPQVDAQGSPMVHIRAIPEGGLSGAGGGALVTTNLPFTFNDRYTPSLYRSADRRQPLPSLWTARYIQGGVNTYLTDFKIWREGLSSGPASCSGTQPVQINSAMLVMAVVRFDEHENSYGVTNFGCTCPPPAQPALPSTSRVSTTSLLFPQIFGPDIGGWMYLNLSSNTQYLDGFPYDGQCSRTLSAQRSGFGSAFCAGAAPGTSGSRSTTQNWVIASMNGFVGPHKLGVDLDAAWAANGCTPEDVVRNGVPARAYTLVCPSNTGPSNCGAHTTAPQLNP